MFICMDCGHVFEEPRVEHERMADFWGAPAWEEFGVCPNCGSVEYDTAEQCERCGEWVPETTDFGNVKLCDFCLEDLTL